MSNFAKVEVEYTFSELFTATVTPAHRAVIGRNMTAPPPLLSPSSILPPHSFHCAFVSSRKNLADGYQSYVFQFFFLRFKSRVSLKLHNWKTH